MCVNILSGVRVTIDRGLDLVAGYIGHLKPVTATNNNISWFYTICSSLWHALSFLSLLFLHQSSGNSFQWQTFPLPLGFWPAPEPQAQQFLANQLSTAQHLHSLYAIQEGGLWSEINSKTSAVEVEVKLWWTISRPVCLGVRLPSGAQVQIFVLCLTIAGFLLWGALSDERMGL
jgi:hypothetical protein